MEIRERKRAINISIREILCMFNPPNTLPFMSLDDATDADVPEDPIDPVALVVLLKKSMLLVVVVVIVANELLFFV